MKGFDPKQKSKGLGDTIAKFTHATKLDVAADVIAKAMGHEDCGCNKRRKTLNEIIPYATEQVSDNPKEVNNDAFLKMYKKQKENEEKYSVLELKAKKSPIEKLYKIEGNYVVVKSFDCTLPEGKTTINKGTILNVNKDYPLFKKIPSYYYKGLIKKL
jgi:hypothetical protein